MKDKKLQTWAWLLVGLTRSLPGILKCENSRLSFITDEHEKIFDVSLSGISNVNFPWHYFGAGFKMKIGQNEYRISFIAPDDGNNINVYAFGENEGLQNLSGRAAGKAWKNILMN